MVDQTKQANKLFTVKPIAKASKYLKMLIYGGFGSGKTELAGTAANVPEMGDVFVMDIEGGARTLIESPRIKNKNKLLTARITEFMAAASVTEYLKRHVVARDANNIKALKALQSNVTGEAVEDIKEPYRFKTVIIDSLTELDLLSMYNLLGIKIENTIRADQEVATFAEYKKNNQMINLVVRALRDIDINVILVCSAQYTQDDQKRMLWTPDMTGKLKTQVQGMVDIVGYLQVGKINDKTGLADRRLCIQPVGRFDAKNRMAKFQKPHLDNPTMQDLYGMMSKGDID